MGKKKKEAHIENLRSNSSLSRLLTFEENSKKKRRMIMMRRNTAFG